MTALFQKLKDDELYAPAVHDWPISQSVNCWLPPSDCPTLSDNTMLLMNDSRHQITQH